MTQETKSLGSGVFVHVSYSENGLLIEIENSGKGVANPCPIIVSILESKLDNLAVAEGTETKYWILPNVDIKLPTSAGGQVKQEKGTTGVGF